MALLSQGCEHIAMDLLHALPQTLFETIDFPLHEKSTLFAANNYVQDNGDYTPQQGIT